MFPRLVVTLAFITVIVTACGGESNDTATPVTTTTPMETTTSTIAASTTTAAPTTTTAAPDEPVTDATTTTTEAPLEPAPVPEIDLAEIPDLIVEWGTGDGDPLDLARRLIGFPLEIGPPPGSTPYGVDLRLFGEDTAREWRWEWTYESFAAPGVIQEIDADLPEGGPGTVEGRLHFDPQFRTFGWSNAAQVISDPSSGGGGPQSVNWSFSDDDGAFRLGDIDATPVSARAWADEDIDIRAGDPRPGHQVEITLESQPNVIPVPLLEELYRALPVAPGARLATVDFRSFERSPDSFGAALGLRYLELQFVSELLPDSAEAAREIYSTGLAGTPYQMGDLDLVNDGEIWVTEGRVDGNGVWRQPVIVLDRYEAEISVWTNDDGTVMSEVDITFEPARMPLEQPEE